jgi:hypothetical protein
LDRPAFSLSRCPKIRSRRSHLDRKLDELIRSTGFQIDAVETGYMKGPKLWTFIYQGSATI